MLRRGFILGVVFILLLIPTTVFAQDPGNSPTSHVVGEGENLFRIGLRYGFTVDELALANGITNPAQIYVGQVIQLPVPIGGAEPVAEQPPVIEEPAAQAPPAEEAPVEEAPAPQAEAPAPVAEQNPSGEVVHIVQANEGLATIARAYGVSWAVIAQANGILNPDIIYAGQELVIPNPTSAPPADYGQPAAPVAGRSIVVDLSDQKIFAYENGAVVREVTVSTGLPGTPTVLGEYQIYSKLPEQTMYGPGYYLPGVPWVMYFYQGYAIHGTYWHNNFGSPMSHGCVNLPSDQALWFFEFAQVGTPVTVIP